MFKKLLNKLSGDFPPKFIPLCDQCRTAYTVAGLSKPPSLPYDEMVIGLHIHGLLCESFCGVTGRLLKTVRIIPLILAKKSREASNILSELGINCRNCQKSLITMAIFIHYTSIDDFKSRVQVLRNKDLICDNCHSISVNRYQDHAKPLENILQSSENDMATILNNL